MATEFTHVVRAAELDLTFDLLPSGGCVLELGAGDGWQANELHRRGFNVTAVDVAPTREKQLLHYPVSYYDGRSLPFADNSFDAIYSSSVLEHISEFATVQRELTRVLRPGGIAVHCVPSGTWRLWTTLGHPLYATRWALRLAKMRQLDSSEATLSRARDLGVWKLVWHGLLPARHGERGNVLSENWLFSRWGWHRRLRESGWCVEHFRRTGVFYTGNELLGLWLSNRSRRLLARILGSSTVIYVARPACRNPLGGTSE